MKIDNRKERRRRASGADMDPEFRRHTRFLASSKKISARDYYNTTSASGANPLPVTAAKIQNAYAYMVKWGSLSAQPRSRAWVRALRALPPDYQAKIGVDQIPGAATGTCSD